MATNATNRSVRPDSTSRIGPGTSTDAPRPGNAPSVGVTVSRPVDAPPGRSGTAPSPSTDGPAPTSVVHVEARNVRAGDDVSLDVSPRSDPVAFDGIHVTVERDGNFTMTVTNSRTRLPGEPRFTPGDGARAIGRIQLVHSITNAEVGNVSYDFRVSKARLRETGTDPEAVTLYRWANDTWTGLPTKVVGETKTHYLLTADSPGMSEFAVGAERPRFDTWGVQTAATAARTGEPVRVSARVTNTGGADGVYHAALTVDGREVAHRKVTVAAGGTRQVNFAVRIDHPGTHAVAINGVPAGQVVVRAESNDAAPQVGDSSLERAFSVAISAGQVYWLL